MTSLGAHKLRYTDHYITDGLSHSHIFGSGVRFYAALDLCSLFCYSTDSIHNHAARRWIRSQWIFTLYVAVTQLKGFQKLVLVAENIQG